MKNKAISFFLIVIILLSFSSCKSAYFSNSYEEDSETILNKAIEYFTGKYPDFEIDIDASNIGHSTDINGATTWNVYIFSRGDKGIGYKVTLKDNVFSDNYNEKLLNVRLKLIDYMNEIMPSNKQYNEYVGFIPVKYDAKVVSSALDIHNGRVEYVVVAKKINIEEQLKRDYLILKKANELLLELNIKANGNWVTYYETDKPDFNNYLTNIELKHYESMQNNSIYTSDLKHQKEVNLIAEYKLGNYNLITKEQEAVNLNTYSDFKTDLHNHLVNSKFSEEKDTYNTKKLLIKELLSKKDIVDYYPTVDKYKPVTQVLTERITFTNNYGEACFSPNGKQIAVIANDFKTVQLINSNTGSLEAEVECSYSHGHDDYFTTLSYSRDQKYLIGASQKGIINRIDLNENKTDLVYTSSDLLIRKIIYSPNGESLACIYGNGDVQIKKAEDFSSSGKLSTRKPIVSFTSEGKYISCENAIYDLITLKKVKELNFVGDIKLFNNKGDNFVVIDDANSDIMLYSYKTEQKIKTFRGHTGYIQDITFHPNDRYLVTASKDKTIRIWDIETGDQVDVINCTSWGYAVSVDFNDRGDQLLVTWDNRLACYDFNSKYQE